MPEYRIQSVGPLQVNAVLCWDANRKAMVVDPGDDADRLLEMISSLGLDVQLILNTHGHFDHVGAVGALHAAFPDARYYLHSADAEFARNAAQQAAVYGLEGHPAPAADGDLADLSELQFGQTSVRVIPTPGHSPGGVCFHVPAAQLVLTGDTLFRGSVGRTDLPGADHDALLRSIAERLYCLPPGTRAIPGHGPATTIEREMRTNMFVRA